jgi:Ca2+-binding RTX toxin-like protein
VYQNETSLHTHNVAEFWDATTIAMVIDPRGNVAIHTASSPGYALTVTDPANFETLYIRGKTGVINTLDVVGNVYSSGELTATIYHGDGGLLSNLMSFIGATGATGFTGATGATGAAGSNGATGATGADGLNGATGATGADGLDGATGATGVAGSNGATGATGVAGSNGATGATGVAGSNGATGATGADGLNGATGADGLNGATGADGLNGATGATGYTGATGPAPTGVNGNLIYLESSGVAGSTTNVFYTGDGNLYVSNTVTTTNVIATTYYGDGGLLSNITGGGGGSSQWTGTAGSPIYYVPNVGIGSSTTSGTNLYVTGNIYASNSITTSNITIANSIDTEVGISFIQNSALDWIQYIPNGSTDMRWKSSGVDKLTLTSVGALTAADDVSAFSDIRYKTEIKKIENALDKVKRVNGYTFMRTDNDRTNRQAGVIAQEFLKVLPEVVHVDPKGMYSVAYGNIVALLIEALKEETEKREALEKRLNEWESRQE